MNAIFVTGNFYFFAAKLEKSLPFLRKTSEEKNYLLFLSPAKLSAK